MIQNLDQIRAAAALEATKKSTGGFPFTRSDVAGFPALILQNGILAAFAYADEKGKEARKGLKTACDKTAKYLSTRGIPVLSGKTTAEALIEALSSSQATSLDLQRATSEALAFFAYLKRFAAKE